MRTITLKSIGVGRYDDVSPFLITDKALSFKVTLPAVNGEFYFVYESDGKTEKRLIPKDGVLTLKGLAAGEFRAEVKHYLKGELIKVYKVEPLLLKEVDGTLATEPEIVDLRRITDGLVKTLAAEQRKAEILREELTKERERSNELAQRLEAAEQTIERLVRFALDDFKENVYLGGGSIAEFNEKYGFAVAEPKGENEDEN